MNKSCYETEILDELNNEQITVQLNEKSNVSCDCKTHSQYSKLREGNKISAVLTKQNQSWEINKITCWQCSVRDIVERIQTNTPIAIVEGTLLRESDSEYRINDPKIWDVLKPST